MFDAQISFDTVHHETANYQLICFCPKRASATETGRNQAQNQKHITYFWKLGINNYRI
jgi:hypothetical protein